MPGKAKSLKKMGKKKIFYYITLSKFSVVNQPRLCISQCTVWQSRSSESSWENGSCPQARSSPPRPPDRASGTDIPVREGVLLRPV